MDDIHFGCRFYNRFCFFSEFWFLYNRVCQWRLVWWSQRSRLGRFEAGTWWCMLCICPVLVYYNRKFLYRSLVISQVFAWFHNCYNNTKHTNYSMESSCQFYITNCYQTHLLLRLLIWFQLWVANFTTILLQINFCFMSGLWVQCHVPCQKWSWRWWKTESYAACCCTGDTQLGSVCCISEMFCMHFTKLQCQFVQFLYEIITFPTKQMIVEMLMLYNHCLHIHAYVTVLLCDILSKIWMLVINFTIWQTRV